MAKPQQRRRVLTGVLWLLVGVALASEILLAAMAKATGHETLAADPCASGWDNPWAAAMPFAFWTGFALTVGLLVRAAIARNRWATAVAVSTLATQLVLGAICWIAANGGYGWHCPS